MGSCHRQVRAGHAEGQTVTQFEGRGCQKLSRAAARRRHGKCHGQGRELAGCDQRQAKCVFSTQEVMKMGHSSSVNGRLSMRPPVCWRSAHSHDRAKRPEPSNAAWRSAKTPPPESGSKSRQILVCVVCPRCAPAQRHPMCRAEPSRAHNCIAVHLSISATVHQCIITTRHVLRRDGWACTPAHDTKWAQRSGGGTGAAAVQPRSMSAPVGLPAQQRACGRCQRADWRRPQLSELSGRQRLQLLRGRNT